MSKAEHFQCSKAMATALRYNLAQVDHADGWVHMEALAEHMQEDASKLRQVAETSIHKSGEARFTMDGDFICANWKVQTSGNAKAESSSSSSRPVVAPSSSRPAVAPSSSGSAAASHSACPSGWTCSICHNWNFANRLRCHRQACPTNLVKKGDWFCARCQNHNYMKNSHCRICGEAKAAYGGLL